jgi:hypothetical protein
MFYDKNSMIEMYELSLLKKKKNGVSWKTILLTSCIEVKTFLSEKDLIQMHRKWTSNLKGILSEKDAAYVINSGNIFLLIHDSYFEQFKEKANSLKVTSDTGNAEIFSSFSILNDEEVEFLLTLPN